MGREAAPPIASRAARSRLFSIDRVKAAAFALGAATVAGFAPLYLFPLPLATLALLMLLWRRADSPRRAAVLGWWFGLGLFLTGVSWVYVSLHTFGAMPLPLAAFFTLLFCAFLALFPAAVAYVSKVIRAPGSLDLALVIPAAWALSEWIRSWIFTGFPWLAVGYSQVPTGPVSGFAPVVGIYGVSFAVVSSAGLLVLLWERASAAKRGGAATRRSTLVAPILILLAAWGAGYGLKSVRWTEPVGEPIDVTLLQGNIPQEIKWTAEGLRTTLRRYRALATASNAKLIVFPETAIPLFLNDVPEDYLADIAEHARRNGGDALLGVPERLDSGDYFNSVISIGTAPTQSYRKSHLVPFGEFLPFQDFFAKLGIKQFVPGANGWAHGDAKRRLMSLPGAPSFLALICYEILFSGDLGDAANAAYLFNITNDAWFDGSIGPAQHAHHARLRAVEEGMSLIRAANSGLTFATDPFGRITAQLAPQEMAVLDVSPHERLASTVFSQVRYWPLLIALGLGLLISLVAARGRRRKR